MTSVYVAEAAAGQSGRKGTPTLQSAGAQSCVVPSLAVHHTGYTFTRSEGRRVSSHRLALARSLGVSVAEMDSWADDEGRQLVVDHLCRNRACIEPSHLELVTQEENNARGKSFSALNAQKERCPQGHAYTADNTVNRATGGRRCRTCQRDRDRRRTR